MKIHEYQAKELLAAAGAKIPKGVVASTAAEAVKAAAQMPGPVVLKAQVHAGGRGKGKFKDSGKDFGGVKFIKSRDDIAGIAEVMLKYPLVTKQTGDQGPKVSQILVQEAAEALRKRLLKNRDKLFTFLRHDGVAWNNNNAENAIKRFAYYREGTVGCLKETGLADYLVLLSIYQTCRYRGVSFLKFLLSGERDVDTYCEHPRRKRQRPLIEVCPRGAQLAQPRAR